LLEAVLTTIKKAIEHFHLVCRQRLGAMVLPERFLGLQSVDPMPGLNQAVMQGAQEPLQPGGDVKAALLGALKDAVVACAVSPYAGRHGVETDCLWLCLGQGQIGQGSSEAAVAVVEGMQGGCIYPFRNPQVLLWSDGFFRILQTVMSVIYDKG